MSSSAAFPQRSLLLSCGLAAIAIATSPAAARADDAPAPAAAPPAADQGEILVTARKRTEKLIQVPVAITALNAKALSDRGIKDLNGLNDFAPGLR